jgi:hypothetical protein
MTADFVASTQTNFAGTLISQPAATGNVVSVGVSVAVYVVLAALSFTLKH